MFERAMRETAELCVTIDNATPATLQALLEYCYVVSVTTDACDDSERNNRFAQNGDQYLFG